MKWKASELIPTQYLSALGLVHDFKLATREYYYSAAASYANKFLYYCIIPQLYLTPT